MQKVNQATPSLSFNQQCLRILRCTAKALASSPGGLRFEPGARPWLEGLQSICPMLPSVGK
ncbi:MAG: hypothetical protein ACK5A0_15740 [Polaromonas sp.]|jgi:hypothetical protein